MDALHGNILIIEDDEDTGDLASRALTSAGYGVRWVKSRDAALVALQRYIYDVILMDYAMPGMPLEEFLKICAAMTDKIVLVSAVVDPEEQARKLGLTHWIAKPYTPDQLIDKLRGLGSGIRQRP